MRLAALALLLPAGVLSQTPPDVTAERAEFARWLETSPVSPIAAIYHQPFGGELTFGPGGDPALAVLPPATLRQEGLRLTLRTTDGTRTVPRNRDVPLGEWRIRVTGERGRSTVTVFGPPRAVTIPGWYAYVPRFALDGTVEPPPKREPRRMLGLDGIEVEAILAGTFVSRLRTTPLRLTVYRMPEPGTEESELMIFFRDETNGRGTYPAGRFLTLVPAGGNRYRADFNRARNPFCAYNGIFPCPLPWPGNAIPLAIEAGERYLER
jgi:hypothetical protein